MSTDAESNDLPNDFRRSRPSTMAQLAGVMAMAMVGMVEHDRRPSSQQRREPSPYEGDPFVETKRPPQDNAVVEKIRADNAARRAANFAKQKKGHRK